MLRRATVGDRKLKEGPERLSKRSQDRRNTIARCRSLTDRGSSGVQTRHERRCLQGKMSLNS